MTNQIDVEEAKDRLITLLDRVAEGEAIVITQNGRPIARLVPDGDISIERRRAVIARIKELRKGLTLGVPVKQLIDEGRIRLVHKFL